VTKTRTVDFWRIFENTGSGIGQRVSDRPQKLKIVIFGTVRDIATKLNQMFDESPSTCQPISVSMISSKSYFWRIFLRIFATFWTRITRKRPKLASSNFGCFADHHVATSLPSLSALGSIAKKSIFELSTPTVSRGVGWGGWGGVGWGGVGWGGGGPTGPRPVDGPRRGVIVAKYGDENSNG
jgi:hypothetical protein